MVAQVMAAAAWIGTLATAHAVTISASIPGMQNSSTTSPGQFVQGFYQFSIFVSGILAFAIIVYGGIKYMASGGNPSSAHEAKEWIEAALLGIVLLAAAVLILKVVNPQLTNLSLPTLTPATVPTSTASTQQAWSSTNPPQNTSQADCDNYCYLPSTCQQVKTNYWSCVAPAGTQTNNSNGVACPPGTNNMCVPPKLCSGSPTLTNVIYTCAIPSQPSTASTVCTGSNVKCPPPNRCVTNTDIGHNWQTCESPN